MVDLEIDSVSSGSGVAAWLASAGVWTHDDGCGDAAAGVGVAETGREEAFTPRISASAAVEAEARRFELRCFWRDLHSVSHASDLY